MDSPPAVSITVEGPSETSTAKDPRFVALVYSVLLSRPVCDRHVMCCLWCRFDWYQTDETVVVCFYTFFKVSLPGAGGLLVCLSSYTV